MTVMTRMPFALPACVALLLTFTAPACFADQRGDFERAYTIYQKQVADGEWKQALASSEDAFYLGRQVFGDNAVKTAALAYNYGRLLNRFSRYDDALPVLRVGLGILEKHDAKNSPELENMLVELGKASYRHNASDAMAYFERAAAVTGNIKPLDRARVDMEVGLFLSNTVGTPRAEPWLESARQGLHRLVGDRDVRTAIVTMQLAKWRIAHSEYRAALSMLKQPLAVFVADPADRGLEIATRAFMVQALERLGRHDEATEDCLIIGKLSGRGRYLPLFKVQPVYPPAALKERRTGWVVVQFTVDEQGYVRDARVMKASSPIFRDAALAAARQFRYAPRFEDGKPVATPGVQNRISFNIVGSD